MSAQQGSFVMLSFILLLQSTHSYYQENSVDSDINEFDDLQNEPIASWKSSDDDYNLYPDLTKEEVLLRENPQLYLVKSMNRKRNNMARLKASKRMTMVNNSIKDASNVPGKPSLSIISPLEALQRKVAVVYNIRQKERNRGLLNNYGKRSASNTYQMQQPEQNDAILRSAMKRFRQVPHYPQIQRRKYFGFHRIP